MANSHPYQFVFLGIADRWWWCRDDTQAQRKALRWAGMHRKRFAESCREGSMGRAIADEHLAQGPHVEWRRYRADSAGIIGCNPVTPWKRLSVGSPQ